MKKLSGYIVIIISFFISWGCGNNSDVQQLKSAFYMMDNDSIDDAEMIITLYADTKMNDECQAIYNLAKARLFYLQDKEIEGDSILNFSIDYYKKKEDKHLLAESYYYKGVLLDEKGNLDAAIANLKEAEIIASNLDDINLTHKIYEMLSSLFLCTNANNLTKEYVCKNLELSKKAKNYNWYLFAACHMAFFYSRVGKTDSMYYYYNSMKPYINVIKKDEEKSIALAVLGGGLVKQNQDLAEDYLKQSVAIKPNVNAYLGLADFYRLKDDFEDAQKYALEAYKYSANTIDSLNSANALLSVKKAMGEYMEACYIYEQIDSIKERMNISERDKNSVRIQAQYNVLAKEKEFQSTIQNITLVVVIIVVVIIIILFYNHVKMMKMKENQLKDQLLLEVYNGKIKDLETSESASSLQVQNLKEKVTQLQQKQGERLSEGKKLYDHILNGGNIVSWAKQDYSNFFDYYTLIDMPFMAHMEKDYDNLSTRSMVYLVLCHLGKTEDEIKNVFGISGSAIRSIKSRTKSRLINQDQEQG